MVAVARRGCSNTAMIHLSPIRLLFALAIALALLLALLFLFVVTDYAFSVWQHLQRTPTWAASLYVAGVFLIVGTAIWLISRVLHKRPPRPGTAATPPDEATLQQRLEKSAEQGVDVQAARQELEALHQRRSAGAVHIVLLGQINVGKSSLVKALLPDAEATVSPRGGATRDITHYRWHSAAGDQLLLTDLPGLNEADGATGKAAREEAIRAHVVIYVCDGDLTRDQWTEIDALTALHKPIIVALNKTDQFDEAELAQLRTRLTERFGDLTAIELVPVSAGGRQEIIRRLPDGGEERILRDRPPQVVALADALQHRLDQDPAALEQLRDTAVFTLAQHKLDAELQAHRERAADQIVSSYTRKAVVGAMAAIAPGADVLIQGYLGVNLVKELCALYDVPVKQLDVDRYLQLVAKQVGRTVPLLLAVTGNALKAFPGIGTLGGGLMHAVAYGLMFDSLGRAVVKTLNSRGDLRPLPAARFYEEALGEDLEARTRRLVRLVLDARDSKDSTR